MFWAIFVAVLRITVHKLKYCLINLSRVLIISIFLDRRVTIIAETIPENVDLRKPILLFGNNDILIHDI